MPRKVIESLSPKEREVICLAMEGNTDSAIARALGISEGTVGTYWGRIRAKMGAYSRTELVALHVRDEQRQEVEALARARDDAEARYQHALKEEQLFEKVMNTLDEGVLVISGEGTILYANPAAHQILRCEAGTLAPRLLTDIVPDQAKVEHARLSFAVHETTEHRDMVGLAGDGSEVRISVSVCMFELDGKALVACYFVKSPAGGNGEPN